MKTLTKLSVVLVALTLSATLFAQSSASASANVTAQLKKGLSITNLSGDLNFGEIIVASSAQTPFIAPASGVRFEVSGHPSKNVTINFSGVTLNNNEWVTAFGGTNGTLLFTPSVEHTGGSSTYSGAASVSDGNSVALVHLAGSGTGYLYLWLGGSLAIAADQPQGDYTGTFTMTVAY